MEWFKTWFNRLYFKLYAHRTLLQAKSDVEGLLALLPELVKADVLDIGCGNARHLATLARVCRTAVGVELSEDAVREAQVTLSHITAAADYNPAQKSLPSIVRADFRYLPFTNSSFSVATSFFTSFGYLEDDIAHLALLREWRRILHSEGILFIDFINRMALVSQLPLTTTRIVDNMSVKEERFLTRDSLRVEKHISISDTTGSTKFYKESIRLYSVAELEALLGSAGFSIRSVTANYAGAPVDADSPRALVIAVAK